VSPRSPAGDVLTELVLTTFRLNGSFLEAAEAMARPVGLTAAWWQVRGAVLETPASVAAIERDLAHYLPNPQHKRAQLLDPTAGGRRAIAALSDSQHRWANRVSVDIGEGKLRQVLKTLERLRDIVEAEASELAGIVEDS
jgi:hypothetical protein